MMRFPKPEDLDPFLLFKILSLTCPVGGARCRKSPPCGNFQHSVITVKIPFISLYSKIYTSPDAVLKKARLEVQKRVLISIA